MVPAEIFYGDFNFCKSSIQQEEDFILPANWT
jgi:hypothetical protein